MGNSVAAREIGQGRAVRLAPRRLAKPWGRRNLGRLFDPVDPDAEPIGEIWFEGEGTDLPLLVKYLFTSEKLSIQVHPDDEAARRAGERSGKDEAWLVVEAEPHATIGIGLRDVMTREEVRAAALDGRIEDMVDWRGAKAGDVYYSPAGTIHALGPGLILVEVQENVDLTYRLYDYGRPRELHLDAALAAAKPVPHVAANLPSEPEPGRRVVAAGPKFVLERWSRPVAAQLDAGSGPVWLIPLGGGARLAGEAMEAGSVWLGEGAVSIELESGSNLLVAYPGAEVRSILAA